MTNYAQTPYYKIVIYHLMLRYLKFSETSWEYYTLLTGNRLMYSLSVNDFSLLMLRETSLEIFLPS